MIKGNSSIKPVVSPWIVSLIESPLCPFKILKAINILLYNSINTPARENLHFEHTATNCIKLIGWQKNRH